MAFAQPLTDSVRRTGQTVLLCQLCENESKLKWKCVECALIMCQRCKDKIHPKFPSAENHTIIDLKDISKHQTDSNPKPDLTKMKCEVHSGQNCCLYCKTCKELVCQTCITNTHNEHKFGDISDEYNTRIDKIRNGQKNIEKGLKTLQVNELKLKQTKSNEQSNYEKMKQETLDDDKAMKNEIQKHTDKLLKELDQKWNVNVSKSFEDEGKKLKEHQSQIQEKIQEIDTLLQPSNAKNVFSGYHSFLKSMEINILPEYTSFQVHVVPKFIHGDKQKIRLSLGKWQDVTFPYNAELQLDKKFKTDMKHIFTVISSPDGSLWICDRSLNLVQKVNPNGDNLNVISDFKINWYDAALLPSGGLLLSIVGASNLKLIPLDSTDVQDSVYRVSPQFASAVHVTCDNKVIVGSIKSMDIHVKGPRQIIVMDQAGHHEKVFRYDRYNRPLFTHPYRVTCNSQGNIAVVDVVTDDFQGRLVVLDQEGGFTNTYTGCPDINEVNPFRPTDIKATKSDNFVVVDTYTQTLHVLNGAGEILSFYKTDVIRILVPYSLSFGSTGQLYISGADAADYDKDNRKNNKLFIVNNFIF